MRPSASFRVILSESFSIYSCSFDVFLGEGDRVFLHELWQLGIMITGLKVHSEISKLCDL